MFVVAGFIISFVGGLPFGPINLKTLKLSLVSGKRDAVKFLLAATMVETTYVAIAMNFETYISRFLLDHSFFRLIFGVLFMITGGYFFFKKRRKSMYSVHKSKHVIEKGLLIGAINLQAIPLWLFLFTFLRGIELFPETTAMKVLMIIAIFSGKAFALSLYSLWDHMISTRLSLFGEKFNHVFGFIFFLIGGSQALHYFTH